ncbi:MAG: menaquinone biosynthesis protein [Planctomycetota bacterium]
MTVAIGGVPYGVGMPLLAGLDRDPACTLVQRPPTELIELLRRGSLDAALVSSVEAIRQPGYRVLFGLGIACKKEVRSVRAFRRRDSKIRTVALDRSSATSATLLQILLRGPRRADTDGPLQFDTVSPTRTPAALPQDLVLLIGDDGLNADPGDREVWDLGREWRAFTGLPFVFAVWLLRRGADHDRIATVLRQARERGRHSNFRDGTYGAVHYDLDKDDLCGLQRFWREARAAGLGMADADPTFCCSTLEGD